MGGLSQPDSEVKMHVSMTNYKTGKEWVWTLELRTLGEMMAKPKWEKLI
jgi:hypothetical protein